MKEETVLVVDDERVVRALVTARLAEMGYAADSAQNAEEAREAMRKKSYPLVISDVKMPGDSGVQLLKEAKTAHPDTQFLMITGSDSLEDAVASLNHGANGYIRKPLNLDELSHAVENALETRRLIIRDREHKLMLERELDKQKRKILDLFLGSIKALATSLEAKDQYTMGHTERVSELCASFAGFARLEARSLRNLKIAASLHDVGKIGVREAVLNKPGKLTDEEYAHIKQHPVLSEQIVRPIMDDEDITLSIRHHHERFDGRGYPDGLKGQAIPLGARIIALADSYDAMTSDRAYRKAYGREEAAAQIEGGRETQFDPDLAGKFLNMLAKGEEHG